MNPRRVIPSATVQISGWMWEMLCTFIQQPSFLGWLRNCGLVCVCVGGGCLCVMVSRTMETNVGREKVHLCPGAFETDPWACKSTDSVLNITWDGAQRTQLCYAEPAHNGSSTALGSRLSPVFSHATRLLSNVSKFFCDSDQNVLRSADGKLACFLCSDHPHVSSALLPSQHGNRHAGTGPCRHRWERKRRGFVDPLTRTGTRYNNRTADFCQTVPLLSVKGKFGCSLSVTLDRYLGLGWKTINGLTRNWRMCGFCTQVSHNAFERSLLGMFSLNRIRTEMSASQEKWCVGINTLDLKKMCQLLY